MRARDRGRAMARIVALGTALAAVCAVAPGTAVANPEARQQQQQQPQQKRVFKIVVVGDSFSAGQGVRGPGNGRVEPRVYFDAKDPRHQSTESAAIQAAARLQAANPHLKVEVTVVAASGAVTTDVFETQRRDPLESVPGNTPQNPTDPGTWRDENDLAVSTRQLDQIPGDADAVVIGLGGNDVFFAPMIRSLIPLAAEDTASVLGKADPLLDTTRPDQAYRDQADQARADGKPGHEATLVARLLQVMAAVQDKAPNARMFLQNYPMAVDPDKTSFNSPLDSDELAAMGRFGERVNAAIRRAAEICGCADLADVSAALKGRELYSRNPAFNDLSSAFTPADPMWTGDEAAHPNRKGASLMSDHIAEPLARRFGFQVPPRQGDRRTDLRDITVRNTPAPDTDGDGTPDYRDEDWDGDGVPNTEDRTPNTPDQTPRSGPGPTGSPAGTQPDPAPPATRPGPAPSPSPAEQSTRPPRSPAPPPPSSPSSPPPSTPVPPRPSPVPRPPSSTSPSQPDPPSPPSPPGPPSSPAPSPEPGPVAPTPEPDPVPPRSNPAPGQPDQAPRASSGPRRAPVIPPTTAMRTPSVPSMPKPPTAPGLQGSIGPRGSQPAPIDRLGTPPPPPTMTVPSPPTKNPYPLGGGKPGTASGGGAAPSAPPLPQKAPPPPAPPSDSFTGV